MEQTEGKMDKTEEEMEIDDDIIHITDYTFEIDLIDKMFPNAKFVIAIDIEELDDIVTDRTNIVIKNTYDCYCYDGVKKIADYFYISGERITNKFIINKLIEQGLSLNCNHCFVEGFFKETSCQFGICTGS